MSEQELGEIDEGIIPLLIELNKKHYETIFSCEGHLNKDGYWEAYLGFRGGYNLNPPNYTKYRKDNQCKSDFYYWEGCGEQSRLRNLDNLMYWAKGLETIEPIGGVYQLWIIDRETNERRVVRTSQKKKTIEKYVGLKKYAKYDKEIVHKV